MLLVHQIRNHFKRKSTLPPQEIIPGYTPLIDVHIPKSKEQPSAFESKRWTPAERRTGLIATKKGMMHLWDHWGRLMPVTVLQLEDTVVVGQLNIQTEPVLLIGSRQINITTEEQKEKFQNHIAQCRQAQLGFCVEKIKGFPVTRNGLLPIGHFLNASHFVPGQLVDCTAISKDKGFHGVMKRWGFKGQSATHGTSLAHRAPGSIGMRKTPGKVWKGKKMPGQMGGDSVTMFGLKVVQIDSKLNLLYVKGTIPGPKESLVSLRDTLYQDKNQFDPYLNPPPFPSRLPEEIEALPEIMKMPAEEQDPVARLYQFSQDK